MFPGKFEFTCLFQLINRYRNIPSEGVSMSLIQDTLWLGGNMIAAFDPVGVTLSSPSVLSELEFEDLVNKLEEAFKDESGNLTEESMQVLRNNPTGKDWTIYIPILLEIIKKLIEMRKKGQAEVLPTIPGVALGPQTQKEPGAVNLLPNPPKKLS